MKKFVFALFIFITLLLGWQFLLGRVQKIIGCGGDFYYDVHCPFGTYCNQKYGYCTPYLAFINQIKTLPLKKSKTDLFPTPVTTKTTPLPTTITPSPTFDADSVYLKSSPLFSGYSTFKFSVSKTASGVLYKPNYGPTSDSDLYALEISESNHLFAKSRVVDLKKRLNEEVTLHYREVVGVIMGEQQLVLVDSVE